MIKEVVIGKSYKYENYGNLYGTIVSYEKGHYKITWSDDFSSSYWNEETVKKSFKEISKLEQVLK